MKEKRLIAIIGAILGLVAGILILLAGAGGRGLEVLMVLVGIGVLYGSYLIYRGRSGWFSLGIRTQTGGIINLVLGIVTLLVPGGVGGTLAILAIVSGVLGLMAG